MTEEIWEPTEWLTLGLSELVRDQFAVWDTASVNNLPDAAFAVIQPGGEKDSEGKTVPRSLRKLPHHTAGVKDPAENESVDKAHLRNALARVAQPGTDLTDAERSRAEAHLKAHAKMLDVGEDTEEDDDGE